MGRRIGLRKILFGRIPGTQIIVSQLYLAAIDTVNLSLLVVLAINFIL